LKLETVLGSAEYRIEMLYLNIFEQDYFNLSDIIITAVDILKLISDTIFIHLDLWIEFRRMFDALIDDKVEFYKLNFG